MTPGATSSTPTFREVSVVVVDGEVVGWNEGGGAYVPDSPTTWSLLWAHRTNHLVVAHTHPGKGAPFPSHEDLTTFAAVEAALGREVDWLIASADVLVRVELVDVHRPVTRVVLLPPGLGGPPWLAELRARSWRLS